MSMTPSDLEEIKVKKVELLAQLLAVEPPKAQGDNIINLWEELYDDDIKSAVVETTTGPSDEATNLVYPYEKIRAVVGDGGNWKWPRMWQRLDEIERRGIAYREGEVVNFGLANKNPNVLPQRCLVVGGGPIGLRMAIELKMAGHHVTVFEKRRETRDEAGELTQLGFTNRINRPHMWKYVRNDLAKFNGRDFMSRQACYPVFTEPETSSIGIDELQCLLLKNTLMLGVDMRLGVGYDDAKIKVDPKTCKPTWDVECSADKHAAEYFKMSEGKNQMTFDVLIGCDGSRSAVRNTQQRYFGNIEKRKFMDCVGIVANVAKLPRKRLRELGFENGQEPSDMNRTKMVFGPFFKKINEEADADLENFIYYKASFHNYIIITPRRQNLVKHGLGGGVYHFAAARSRAGVSDEKTKLRDYVQKVLQVAGIPVDPDMPNGGFVEAPNDVMAFDFAECWNTPKNIAFELAPPDYNVEEHGPWVGPSLCPMVGLAGDALLEPFWPLGLGLKRGWQAVMDVCYAVDNLYNRTLLCDKLGKSPDTFSWTDHWLALTDDIKENFVSCSSVEVAEDLGKGEFNSDGVVMLQWKKLAGELERPEFLVEVDPGTRYKKKNQTLNSAQKRMMLEDKDWKHPVVQRALAINEYTELCKKSAAHNAWKKLVSIQGKTIVEVVSGYTFKAPAPAAAPAKPMVMPQAEIEKVSMRKRESLIRTVTANQIDEHIGASSKRRQSQIAVNTAGLLASLKNKQQGSAHTEDDLHEIGHVAPDCEGLAASSEAMWDRMLEKGFTHAQTAELAHVRNMISSLQTSIEGYRKAEKAILMGSKA